MRGGARGRILEAMVGVVGERGFAAATVTRICARAKVSRATFAEHFDGPQDCFLAVLAEGYGSAVGVIGEAFEREESWLEGVRGALAGLLCFFDSDPARARVLLVESVAAGAWARERRESYVLELTSSIEERWGAPPNGHLHPLVTAGVMSALLGTLYSHLVAKREEPLITLLGALMGLTTAPYLDQREIAREIERADALASELLARRARTQPTTAGSVQIPELLLDPRAHRARACLCYLAEHPNASNRQIARAAGIATDTHISTLLARLHGAGLLHKQPAPPGGSNAWTLTPTGAQTTYLIRSQNSHGSIEDT